MSITYVGFSTAKEGESERLRQFFESLVMPAVRGSEGCVSCQLLQDQDNPHRLMVIEVWASVEAHQASIKNIPAESIGEFMSMVSEPPKGNHYRSVLSL